MRKLGNLGWWAVAATLVMGSSAQAAIDGLELVASDLTSPIFVTHAPGDRERLFIVERGTPSNSQNASAAIKILDLNTGTVLPTTFLTITGVENIGEGGLLGLAFHPDFATNGKFYVNVTTDNGGLVFQNETSPFSTRIREYTVSANPNVASTSFTPILDFIQPQSNHNAGWIGFSPVNGYLHIPTGDGGGGNDRDNDGDDDGHTPGIGNAQDITGNLLGKLLRIDVDSDDFPSDPDRNYRIPDDNPYADVRDPETREVTSVVTGDDEIWATGLRNPFRDSFDRHTGDLWLGDVGQSAREEIDRQPFDAPPGENFGWRLCEGSLNCSEPADYRAPVYDYNRDFDSLGGSVVTGGYVYRGPDPSLQGQYFFLDSRNSPQTNDDNYWMFDPANPYGSVLNIDSSLTPNTGSPSFPVSFGEDAKGNLYIAYLISGDVYRIVTDELLPGDYDADGEVDDDDYQVWVDTFGSTTELDADGNGNDVIDAGDYTIWRDNRGNSVHDLGAGSGAIGTATVPEPAAIVLCVPLLGLMLLGVSRRGKI